MIVCFAVYRDFLAHPISQSCVITGAVDQLVGPGTEVHAGLTEDHASWKVTELELETTRTKAWIEERGRMLRAAVATRCDHMPDGAECRSDGSCLTHSCPAGMRCEQGSIGPTCISGMDACGCAAGSGWSGTLQPGCCRCGSRIKPGSLPPVAPR